MSAETLARWQFAITTVYHFMIVPVSIGLACLVAGFQTAGYRTGNKQWDDAAKFYGKLMLVSFAIGVATGIVQEFQFGMNWSEYSRFVGDVFGAPLAMEGLVAFFLESTFLGLWIFGRDKLSPRLHLLSIQLVALGTVLSAYFILAANSWMQHPVAIKINPDTGRPQLTSIWALLTNSTQLVTFPHTVFAAGMTAGAIVLSVSAWHLRRGSSQRSLHEATLRVAAVVVLVCAAVASGVGHIQGQIMTSQQPMKMAAAEALWRTTDHAPFSLFAVGDVSKGENKVDLSIPDGLSILAHNRPSSTVEGITDVQAASIAKYGPGSYVPVVWMAYWFFRLMMGFGILSALLALAVLVQIRRRKLLDSPRLLFLAVWAAALPLLANSAGWLFTETARQPWLVYGLLKTRDGVSVGVGSGHVLATLVGFTLLYAGLGVVALRLFLQIGRQGPDETDGPGGTPVIPGQAGAPAPVEPVLVD